MAKSENTTIEPSDFSRPIKRGKKSLIKLSPVKISLMLLFLTLICVALFMFNAKAVQFNIEPKEAKFKILSGLPVYRLGERYLMLKGDYDIRAEADGYHPFFTSIQVTEDSDQNFDFTIKKLPGTLKIVAVHEGKNIQEASVFIDDVLKGETELPISEVEAGSRDILITHPLYIDAQAIVDVVGMRKMQSEKISLLPAWANISINSRPIGATITIDKETVGTTPAIIKVIQGQRSLEIKKPGYKSHESLLTVYAQKPEELEHVILEKANGVITIASVPEKVNVTISGQYFGQTPLEIDLAPDKRYNLVASRAGYQNYTQSLSLRPDENLNLNLSLKPVVGRIKVAVKPNGASMFVDGQSIGNADQVLELNARAHELRIELEGYAPYKTKVIPQPGLPQQLNILLLTEEEAKIASIPRKIETGLGNILKLVIPDTFDMGANRREPGRRSNEIQKKVRLTRFFYLGAHEIDNNTFRKFNPGHNSGSLGRALLNEKNRPAVNISWEEATQFCNWLSDQDGLPAAYVFKNGTWSLASPATIGYRLPTEAEWAWAARYSSGKKPTRFPWGNQMPPILGSGNYADVSAANMVPYSIKDYNDNYRGPAPSGTFASNALGIYDLAGNVSEWTNDHYSIELHKKILVDPLGPGEGDSYVVRGSNYTHGRFSELRWTFRDYGSNPRPDVGFRIARFVE